MEMLRSVFLLIIAGLVPAVGLAEPTHTAQLPPTPENFIKESRFAELEKYAAEALESRARNGDGQLVYAQMIWSLYETFESFERVFPGEIARRIVAWKKQFPESALARISEAMSLDALAWDARGHDYAPNVDSEAFRVFHDYIVDAWAVLEKCKAACSSSPAWYEYSIAVGTDLGLPEKRLRALFDEGIRKFPGYNGIYFAYIRHLTPVWGGSYAASDAFIREQVAANTNPDGEILYTRLYWVVDQHSDNSASFFQESRVDWRRMRAGFEKLINETPYSNRNLNAFGSYACRAGDATTYLRLQPKLQSWALLDFLPRGGSMQDCDARMKDAASRR
jgi:hypothetical protein